MTSLEYHGNGYCNIPAQALVQEAPKSDWIKNLIVPLKVRHPLVNSRELGFCDNIESTVNTKPYLLLFSIVITSLLFGFINEGHSLYLWSILSVVISVSLVYFLDTKYSVLIVLGFISFQGFLKVISNYHPVVHLGADLIVITLVLKVLIQKFLNKLGDTAPTTLLLIFFLSILVGLPFAFLTPTLSELFLESLGPKFISPCYFCTFLATT